MLSKSSKPCTVKTRTAARTTDAAGRTERARLLELFDEAFAGGAARYKVAELTDISECTLKRWRSSDGRVAFPHIPIGKLLFALL